MGAIKLAAPEMGMDVEALTNLMFRYYRELEYLLNGNIDSQNVKSLTTDKIIAGEALIGTALIDVLTVGDNVAMGDNAYIAWDHVNDSNANALAAWTDSNYATYIDAGGVYSGSFNGGMFNVNPTGIMTLPSGVTFGGWKNGDIFPQDGSWIAQAFVIRTSPDALGPNLIFSSTNDFPVVFNIPAYFNNPVRFNDNVDFNHTVDFTDATVYGVVIPSDLASYSLTSHNHSGVYSVTSHNHSGVYAPASHTHDDRYYTESESDAKYLWGQVYGGFVEIWEGATFLGKFTPE